MALPTEEVLAGGVEIVAQIHHAHGVKAAVSALILNKRFPNWSSAFWHEALVRSQWYTEPRVKAAVSVPAIHMSPSRSRIMLERAVLPYAYAAVRSWIRTEGAGAVIKCYLNEACSNPGYLGHRSSILLAFAESWNTYAGTRFEELWLDRLCEYLIACKFSGMQPGNSSQQVEISEVQALVLRRPGFFGHHLIAYMWSLRMRHLLSESQFSNALAWAKSAAETVYEDAEDNLLIEVHEAHHVSEPMLEAAIRKLLIQGCANIHLLTLSAAIAWLWDNVQHTQRGALLALAAHLTLDSDV
jgi:hypothetical protein